MKKLLFKFIFASAAAFAVQMSMLADNWPTVIRPTINSSESFYITSYGATASSKDNTKAIQAALDACGDAGGGKVVIPADTFLCGPIVMSSNTNLYLSAGAVLEILPYGSGNGIDANTYPNNGTTDNYNNFITCKAGATNLMISGKGTIYGNGSAWWKAFDANNSIKRGALIRLMKAKYIEISGITIKDAPGSHLTIGMGGNSSNATIHDIRIDTKVPSHNTDGIDLWGPNVDIYNCYISDGDDNIAIDKGSQYIRIKNCTFGFGHGTSVGSFTSGVAHVLIDSCTYFRTDNGLRLKSDKDRGGGEHDFTISNCVMDSVLNPIYIDCYYGGKPSTPAAAVTGAATLSSTTPAFRDVLIKNVTATRVPYYKNMNKYHPVFIYGRPEQHVKNITFDNVHITGSKGMLINFADSVRFINGCNVRDTLAYGLTMAQSYQASFVDTLASFALPAATENISGSGKNDATGYSWNYGNMGYVAAYSSHNNQSYYQFNSSDSVTVTAADGCCFKDGDFVAIDAYTYKANQYLAVFTDSSMMNCIGQTALTAGAAQKYYLFLNNVPEHQGKIYIGGNASVNTYVFFHAIDIYGSGSVTTGIHDVTSGNRSDSDVRETTYYDLCGRKITSAYNGQMVIRKTLFTDGSVKSDKILLK